VLRCVCQDGGGVPGGERAAAVCTGGGRRCCQPPYHRGASSRAPQQAGVTRLLRREHRPGQSTRACLLAAMCAAVAGVRAARAASHAGRRGAGGSSFLEGATWQHEPQARASGSCPEASWQVIQAGRRGQRLLLGAAGACAQPAVRGAHAADAQRRCRACRRRRARWTANHAAIAMACCACQTACHCWRGFRAMLW
jgi:hypothetical protein